MRYRFRKPLERPDWKVPLVVTLEIAYEGRQHEVSYTPEESVEAGGVTSYEWCVVAVQGPCGQYHNPGIFYRVKLELDREVGLEAEILDACMEDLAHRT